MTNITLTLTRDEALNLSWALLDRLNQIEDYDRKSGDEHLDIVSDIENRVHSALFSRPTVKFPKLPKAYTSVLEHRGYFIARRNDLYDVFDKDGGIFLRSTFTSQNTARKGIDEIIQGLHDDYGFSDALVPQD